MERRKRVYLAGPMRGKPFFNFPAFDRAAERLRQAGFDVFSPAENDRLLFPHEAWNNPTGDEKEALAHGFNLRVAFCFDVIALINSDAIALLPGWNFSKGATLEYRIAKYLGLEVLFLPESYAT